MATSYNLTPDELRKLQEMDVGSDSEIQDALAVIRDGERCETAVMAGIDGVYELGDITLPPVTPQTIVLLDMIDSPLLRGASELSAQDVMAAVYVCAVGVDAVRPVISCLRRQRAAAKTESIAGQSPELYDRYLAHIDRIQHGYSVFYESALEFWAQIGPVTLQEATDTIIEMFVDAFGGFAMLPNREEDSKKK